MKAAVACGGTGGHVFPGLATARELLSRGHEVTLWLTGRDTEQSARRDWDGPVVEIPARGFPAGFSGESFRRAWNLGRAVWRSRARMRADRPDVLLAMGSYASVGPCGAARLLGVPIVLHEANVIPGRAVRLFSRAAAAVATGFEETRYHLPGARLAVVGIPLRDELTEAARNLPPRDRSRSAPLRLLVVGGSLGAHRLNEVTTGALARLQRTGERFAVTHLTGPKDAAEVRAAYAEAGVEAEVIDFTKYMAPLYHAADLAICRAGASTCAELAFFGVPALFVPYPHAAMDHQTANARALVDAGAALLLREGEWTAEALCAALAGLLADEPQLAAMRTAMLAAARPEAARTIYDQLAMLCEG